MSCFNKKTITAVAALLFFIPFTVYALEPSEISARSAVLIDRTTGDILFSKNENRRMKPASTTKILTGIIALERCDENAVVTVSENAASAEGSSMYLKRGDKMKMGDLIYGLMLNSGNDAAVAISEYISGSEEKFATLMNQKAKEIGAKNSNFVTPDGLDDENHYTTAYDLAVIASYAMSNERFRETVSTVGKVAETLDGVKKYMHNHNKLLKLYDGCNGIKTGFTKASGRTLVSSAEKDGMELIAVTLNAPDDWNDHRKMLDFGFENHELMTFLKKGEICARFQVTGGTREYVGVSPEKDISLTVGKNGADKYRVEFPDIKPVAPIKKGDPAGTAYILDETGVILSAGLFAAEDIPRRKMSFREILMRFLCLV